MIMEIVKAVFRSFLTVFIPTYMCPLVHTFSTQMVVQPLDSEFKSIESGLFILKVG